MLIRFKRKFYEIAEPKAGKTENLIHVEKYLSFDVPPDPGENVFRFSHRLPKLLFFLIHEGVRLTWNKILASRLQRQIIQEKTVVLAHGRLGDTNQYAIGIGPQSCTEAECFIFPIQCTMIVAKERRIEDDFQLLATFFEKKPSVLQDLYYYSPFSGKDLTFDLENVLSGLRGAQSLKEHNLPTPRVPVLRKTKVVSRCKLTLPRKAQEELFLVGAGAYACSYILPNLKNMGMHTVVDLNPLLACIVQEKYRFQHASTSCDNALYLLSAVENPVLVVGTYHSTHVPIAEQALTCNPRTRVMVEKPPATSLSQLNRLIELRRKGHSIEIGYNRRYSPFVIRAKKKLSKQSGPITMSCLVREKSGVPLSHWYYWPNQGTRVNGNLCHWIDLGMHFIQKLPVAFTAISPQDGFAADEPVISILFEDNSLLNIVAMDRGNTLRGIQEFIDVRRGDLSIQIDDFLKMTVRERGYSRVFRSIIRDKGHGKMYSRFACPLHEKNHYIYPNRDLFISSYLCFVIADALLNKHRYVEVDFEDHLIPIN